jgi:hypothetical protein
MGCVCVIMVQFTGEVLSFLTGTEAGLPKFRINFCIFVQNICAKCIYSAVIGIVRVKRSIHVSSGIPIHRFDLI